MDSLIQSVAKRYAATFTKGAPKESGSWTPEGRYIPGPKEHYKVVCRICGTVTDQCRCTSPDRVTVLTTCNRCLGITAAAKVEDPNDAGILQRVDEARKALGLHSELIKQKQKDIREVNHRLKQISLEINDDTDLTNRVIRRFITEVIDRYPKMGPLSDWKDADIWVNNVQPIKITTDDDGWPYEDMGDHLTAIKDVLMDMKNASVDPIVSSVARRYAMAIGDIPNLIRSWETILDRYEDLEIELPHVLSAQEYLSQHEGEPFEGKKREVSRFFSDKKYGYILFPKSSLETLQRIGVQNIFLSLLQQYDLPSEVRKKVEACSRFYEKTRFVSPKNFEDGVKAFQKLFKLYTEHLAIAKDAFGKATVRGVNAPTILKAGPFRVVNTGGFDEATMANCVKVIEKAAHLLAKKGLGKVCYGDALISNTLTKSKVLAFYMVSSDEFFVRANLKGKEGAALQTIIHELAHRLYFKFLQSNRRDIARIYQVIKSKVDQSTSDLEVEIRNDPALSPKPGDTVVEKGKTYIVERVGYGGSRSGYQVTMHREDDPSYKAVISLKGWAALKGIKPKSTPGSGFITPYAGKNDEENFAEMVAFYCMDELPQDQVELLEKVL